MKGLLRKDLYTFVYIGKTMLLMLVFVMVITSFNASSVSFVPGFTILMGFSYSISLFSYDESSSFDRFACCMPVSRGQIVTARYLAGLLVVTLVTVVSALVSFALGKYFGMPSESLLFESFGVSGLMFLLSIMVISIMYPLVYKLGSNKARLLLIVGAVFSAAVLVGLVFVGDFLGLTSGAFALLIGGIAAVVVAGFLVSIRISTRIYAAKEF